MKKELKELLKECMEVQVTTLNAVIDMTNALVTVTKEQA